MPILIGVLGAIPKGLVKGLKNLEIEGQVKNIHTTAVVRSARILRRVLETWGDSLSLKLLWETIIEKPSAGAGVKNPQE